MLSISKAFFPLFPDERLKRGLEGCARRPLGGLPLPLRPPIREKKAGAFTGVLAEKLDIPWAAKGKSLARSRLLAVGQGRVTRGAGPRTVGRLS